MNFIGSRNIFASPKICTIIKTYTQLGNNQLVFAAEKCLNIVCVFSCSNNQQSPSEKGMNADDFLNAFACYLTTQLIECKGHFTRRGLPIEAVSAVIVFSLAGQNIRV